VGGGGGGGGREEGMEGKGRDKRVDEVDKRGDAREEGRVLGWR